MRLEFVNHASFVLDAQGVRLLSDPWLEGNAFNNGWGLLSKTSFRYEDFGSITHLWFSHEHPDHFSPPTLKKIPAEHRAKITVLFQKTGDRKVVEFCRKLGFKQVDELPADTPVTLAPGFQVTCSPAAGFEDSWLYVRTPQGTLLNMNDCWIVDRHRLEQLKQQVGPVDVLATQFSVSAWDGNEDEVDRLRRGARAMLDKALVQCEVFKPRHVLPFASFIWFCHQENRYMNQAFLGIDEVEAALRTRSQPVLLYPGDGWTLGESHDPSSALARYRADQQALADRPGVQAATVAPEALMEASRGACKAMLEGSDPSRVRARLAAQALRRSLHRRDTASLPGRLMNVVALKPTPAKVWVNDHQQGYLFDLQSGLTRAPLARQDCDISLGSESLNFAFKFLWGGQTLAINGRFQETTPGSRAALFDYFEIAGNLNAGRAMSWKTLPAEFQGKVAKVAGWLHSRMPPT